ncbi:MAG: ATP-binding cassette domain-containing protein, partial [Myxococcaceae bacterium]
MAADDTPKAVRARGLVKCFGDFKAIDSLDLSIDRGAFFAFLGPNGAGKSTTIRLLLSLIYPTSGEARVFGKDCIEFGPELRQE